MRYLGLDLGTKSLGLAISDKSGIIASPYKVLKHDNDYYLLIELLKKIVLEEQIDGFVLGLPKNMNNTSGKRVDETLIFKNLLLENFELPVELMDERLSTSLAEKFLISGNVRRGKRKTVIDSIAASVILDTFLERIRNEKSL